LRRQGHQCGFGLSRRRRRGDDKVGIAPENERDSLALDVAELRPALVPNPALDAFVEERERGGLIRS